jgi:hypothetical protein
MVKQMYPRFILFTGHRDKKADPKLLEDLAEKYPDSVWIHGDAEGFDTQVRKFAFSHGIQQIQIPPAYKTPSDHDAPLRRNDLMLELCQVVVALYDGRLKGGTKYTIDKANFLHKPIRIWKPLGE